METCRPTTPFCSSRSASRKAPLTSCRSCSTSRAGAACASIGGVSPITQQCRDLLAAIRAAFPASGLSLPVYWGNRNWTPYLTDTVRAMAADGVKRAVALVTSAYSSYSSCRQYLEDIERARAEVGPAAPRIDKIRPFFNHPGFIEPFAASTRAARGPAPPHPAGRRPPGVYRAQHPGRDGPGQRPADEGGRARGDGGREPP